MSTIASPRPSSTVSSRRNSASTDTTTASTSNRAQPADAAATRTTRRNRAALRDYYGLKVPNAPAAAARDASASPSVASTTADQQLPDNNGSSSNGNSSELDQVGFEPGAYAARLLAHEGLEGVLRVAAGLVADIRALDGEKKALVYDNYSKLIAATDTIRRMRERMDPMTPTTATLTPAIAHIAATAGELAASLRGHEGVAGLAGGGGNDDDGLKKKLLQKQQRETVRWVLAAPDRMRRLVAGGEREAAKLEWREVSSLLDKWRGVKGAEDVRLACLKALADVEDG